MRIRFFTSYYQKMAKRHKIGDVYIQVSRNVVCYAKDLDNEFITKQIDINAGELLGNYEDSLEDYYKYLNDNKKDILDFFNDLQEDVVKEYNVPEAQDLFEDVKKELEKEFKKPIKEITDKELEVFLTQEKANAGEKPTEEEIDCLKGILHNDLNFNIFLLCHENLESKYTKKDEEKYNGVVKNGDYKQCHRRVLAKWLEENTDLKIPEWNIQKENESIVYRDYF